MRRAVISRLQAAVVTHGLDALVAASPDNVTYSLGFAIPSQSLAIRNRLFLFIVGRSGATALIAAAPEVTFVQMQDRDLRTIPYDEFSDDPMLVLVQVLREIGVEERCVGIETDFLPGVYFDRLRMLMPEVVFVSAASIYAALRAVKTPEEVELLRRVNQAARRAWVRGCADAHVGIAERDLARLMIHHLYDEGVDEVRLVQVGSGVRSSFANPYPTDRRIEQGDLVKVDISATMGGYYSDTGGAAVAGSVPKDFARIWSGMVRTQEAVLRAMRPGISTRALWEIFEREFAAAGLKVVNRFIGHSLGISVHEEPFIGRDRDVPLAEGMVLAVEPVFKVPGELGFHLEDVVVVTGDGIDALTDPAEYAELRIIS